MTTSSDLVGAAKVAAERIDSASNARFEGSTEDALLLRAVASEIERRERREQHLLEANNRYLERARAAEAREKEAKEEAAYFLARAREAEARRDAAELTLEPFADVAGEGDEDFPDDTKCTVKMGRGIYYALVLGHFRRATQVIRAIPVDDDETRECLACAHLVRFGDKMQGEASGEIFCEACAYTYADIKAQHDEALASGEYGELTPAGIAAFAEDYAAHVAAGGSPDDKPLYVLGKDRAP